MARTAIELLKQDHREVRKLLEQLAGTTARAHKTRPDLLKKIEREVVLHTRLEEELFYPAFRESGGADGERLYIEATEEHRAVDELVMPDLGKTDPGSEAFSGRAKVLRDLIEHHIEEEESQMFPQAEQVMSAEQLEALGDRMAERKKALKQQ